MKEHGAIFSPAMVLALRGGRKTQTRRLSSSPLSRAVPGDRLWVRETCKAIELLNGDDVVEYLADATWQRIANSEAAAEAWLKLNHYRTVVGAPRGSTVPAIHMPRWACRTLLTLHEVRIERLNAISEADAKAEGCQQIGVHCGRFDDAGHPAESGSYVAGYAELWDSLHGKKEGEAWADNPEVVALTFSVESIDIGAPR